MGGIIFFLFTRFLFYIFFIYNLRSNPYFNKLYRLKSISMRYPLFHMTILISLIDYEKEMMLINSQRFQQFSKYYHRYIYFFILYFSTNFGLYSLEVLKSFEK
jgi:hypothetical protein